MNFNPIPIKVPDKILNDQELAPYFDELTRSLYQLWFGLNGNRVAALISTTSIDATATGSTELLKVPPNKSFIPLYVVIRIKDFTAGSKSTQAMASFGGNASTYDDFLNSVTYTVTAANTFQIDSPNDATELSVQAAGDSFKVIVETASNATVENWNIDLFGYFV